MSDDIDPREAQRRSFALGNASISNENITREHIDAAAQKIPTTRDHRHVPDIAIVLSNVLSRMTDRRHWDHRRAMIPGWAPTTTGGQPRREGSGWTLTAGTSVTIIIWRRPDGRWGGWTFEPGHAPEWGVEPFGAHEDGFTLTCAVCRPDIMSEDQAKRAAVSEARNVLVSRAAAALMDAAVLDETFVEHQL